MFIHALPVQGYFLQPYKRLPKELPSHWLGHDGVTRGNCPECDQRFICLLSLEVADARLEIQAFPVPRLHLQVCAACQRSNFTFTSAGELISLRTGGDNVAFPGRSLQPPTLTPIALHAIPDRVAEVQTLANEGRVDETGDWAKAFDWHIAAHQLGGQPALAGNLVPSAPCPLCFSPAPFFASLACKAMPEFETEEAEIAQVLFFICRSCVTVVAQTAFHRNP